MKWILFIFLCFILFLLYLYSNYLTSSVEPLHKFYTIDNNIVIAKMDIPEFTDLGVISVHTHEGIQRTRDTCTNDIMYTNDNTPWRKHREIGKYIRHSEEPNCEVYKSSPMSFGLRTIHKINIGDEITTDYYPLQRYYNI